MGHALLTVAGSLLGNARWIRVEQDWVEPPILFSALVGDPSSGKSPALGAVLGPLRTLEAEFAADYRITLADYTANAEIAATC